MTGQHTTPEATRTLLEWLDLDYPGLEAVKAACERGSYEAAAAALLDYYRRRNNNVRYYDGWQRPAVPVAYDRSRADAICRNHLVHQDLPAEIDWQADPVGDPEWTYCLNRHEFLTELGRAYWYTGDETYTRAWTRLLGDWIRKNPMPDLAWLLNVDSEVSRKHFMKQGTWRPLTLGIRLYTAFVPCFYHFLHSPEFSPAFLVTVLTSMVEHARHTRLYYTRHKSYFNVSPNWGLMESNGLAHMGILFPEFKEAKDWQAEAISRLEEQIRLQLTAEGMQVERAAGYHLVCTFCFLQILDLARRNGVRVSDTYVRNAERMVDFVLTILKPHGVYPMLKDGDESDVFGERASYGLWEDINNLNMLEDANDLRWVLKAGARLFGRPDLQWAATHGREGQRPTVGSVALPDAGFCVMRTGWDPDALYAVFTCGPLGAIDQNCVHGHADALSLDVSGYGQTLLIDPGRYLYEGPWRIWFKSTAAHNTVSVDGMDSSELADEWMFQSQAHSTLRTFATTDLFDYADGEHDGFGRLPDPVTHRRRIVFVKPHFWLVVDELEAVGTHAFTQFWHFAPQAQVTAGANGDLTARYDSGAGIRVQPVFYENLAATVRCGSEDPIQGWVSTDYAVKVAAPTLELSGTATGPTVLATVLLPFRDKAPELTVTAAEADRFYLRDGGRRWVILLGDGQRRTRADFAFDGEALCALFDEQGRLLRCGAAGSSWIRHRDRVLLDATVRHKTDTTVTLEPPNEFPKG